MVVLSGDTRVLPPHRQQRARAGRVIDDDPVFFAHLSLSL
jgi:hypothetical protein